MLGCMVAVKRVVTGDRSLAVKKIMPAGNIMKMTEYRM